SDWDSVSDRRRDASASTGYRPGHIAPLPLQVAAFALRESARIPTSTSRAGFRPGPRIEVLAGDEAGEARWHASALKGVAHLSILVDDGSCDRAGETLRDASDKTSVTFGPSCRLTASASHPGTVAPLYRPSYLAVARATELISDACFPHRPVWSSGEVGSAQPAHPNRGSRNRSVPWLDVPSSPVSSSPSRSASSRFPLIRTWTRTRCG